MKEQYRDSQISKYFMSGIVSTSVAKTFTAPLERLKIVHQTYYLLKINTYDKTSYFNQIMREQKFFSLWRGNFINVLRTIPNTFIRYPLFELMQRQGQTDFISALGFQTFAAWLSCIFSYPFDVVRVRLSGDMSQFNKQRNYQSGLDCLKKIFYYEGFTGIYKGFLISSAGLAPYLGLSMTAYNQLKQLNFNQQFSYLNDFIKILGIGPLSAMLAMGITYPIDTIKRRMQINGSIGARKEYLSTIDCIKKILKNEGLRGYYKGIGFCMFKIIPEASIQFGIYEKIIETNFSE